MTRDSSQLVIDYFTEISTKLYIRGQSSVRRFQGVQVAWSRQQNAFWILVGGGGERSSNFVTLRNEIRSRARFRRGTSNNTVKPASLASTSLHYVGKPCILDSENQERLESGRSLATWIGLNTISLCAITSRHYNAIHVPLVASGFSMCKSQSDYKRSFHYQTGFHRAQ